ncbi:hypothetical protein [Cellulomonas sp.]|nr:hypothetical protein [Cellulomonas sp.]
MATRRAPAPEPTPVIEDPDDVRAERDDLRAVVERVEALVAIRARA